MDLELPIDQQIQKLKEKTKAANLPSDLLEKVDGMITLLRASIKSGGGTFTDFENTANYVSWICSLPFEKETQDIMDLNIVKQTLDKNHYGLDNIKSTILEYLSSLILNMEVNQTDKAVKAPILCLIGLVGTGKTTLAISIAEAMGRKFERIPFGGMGDSLTLRGQSRSFSDAEPGQVIKKLVHSQSKNCVILLDELDRVAESARSDIMGVLVELLDSEQNKFFTDHYIDYPFDLSHVLFIATANNTTNVSTAVLDRLEIIQMPSYNDEEKTVIGRDYIFPKVLQENGLSQKQILIEDAIWPSIIRPLGYDSGTRSLQRTVEGICRKVARMVVEGKLAKDGVITVNAQNLRQFVPM